MNKKRQGGPGYEKLFGDQIFGWNLPCRYGRIIHDTMDSCLNIRLISCDYSFHICSHFD